MGKTIKEFQFRGRQMKLGITLFFCLLTSVFMTLEAAASVDFVNQWPAIPTIVSNGNAGTVIGKFTPGMGTNRLMLVAIATEYSAAQAPTFTVTYGGQPLTGTIVSNTTGNNKIWLGYFNETAINNGALGNKTMQVTGYTTTNLTALYATVAVFNGVDQTTPITGFNSLGTTVNGLTIGPVAYTTGSASLAGNTGMSVYLANWNNNVGQTTVSSGYTENRDYLGTNFSLSANYKVITNGASNESITSTITTTQIAALAG